MARKKIYDRLRAIGARTLEMHVFANRRWGGREGGGGLRDNMVPPMPHCISLSASSIRVST